MRSKEQLREDAIKILEDKIDKLIENHDNESRSKMIRAYEIMMEQFLVERSKRDDSVFIHTFGGLDVLQKETLPPYAAIRHLLDRINNGEDPVITRLELD